MNALFPRVWRLYGAMWYPVDTGQVTEHVYAVRVRDVNMFIYADGGHAIAIDATYAGGALFEELKRLPIAPESVTHLFLTHADVDHAGGVDAFPNAQICLSRDEERKSIRKLAALQGIGLLCTAHTGCIRDYARAMR